MSYKTNREQRTKDAFSQFTRYSSGIATDELADVLDSLTNINDDIENGRHTSCIKETVEQSKTQLDAVYADYVRQNNLPFIPVSSSVLAELKYRLGILKSSLACVTANADALQKQTRLPCHDPIFTKMLSDLETEIASTSALIKTTEAACR